MPGGRPKIRRRLWERDPHCHWCGRLTVYDPPKDHQTSPPEMATIDHLYPRYHPQRHAARKPGERRLVLACHECNTRRNTEDFGSLPAEQRRAMSQAGGVGKQRRPPKAKSVGGWFQ